MDSLADALVIDATTCMDFFDRLLSSSPLEFQSRHPPARQLCIIEDGRQHLPMSFHDALKRLLCLDARRLFSQIVALRAQCETSLCLRGTVQWAVALGQSLTILHLHVKCGVSVDTCTSSLRVAHGRLPRLQTLDIGVDVRLLTPGQVLDLALQVVALCDSLQSLTTLSLPVDIVETAWQLYPEGLSQIPMLQELSLSPSTSSHIRCRTTRRSGGFASLQTLRARASFQHVVELVRAVSVTIRHLSIECDQLENANEATHAIRNIVDCLNSIHPVPSTPMVGCHARPSNMSPTNLNALFLPRGVPKAVLVSSLTVVDIIIHTVTPDIAQSFTLVSLLSAPSLQRLSVRYPYALSYTTDDVADMLGNWHSIRVLSLNPRPIRGVLNHSTLPPLAVLAIVARCGPCLREFNGLLDCSAADRPQPEHTWSPSLQKLDLGQSLGPSGDEPVKQVAQYIRDLFPTVKLVAEDCSSFINDLGLVYDA